MKANTYASITYALKQCIWNRNKQGENALLMISKLCLLTLLIYWLQPS